MAKGYVIAIDGPVASGKGTIAPLLSQKLKGFYLQTGAMYRAVALHCLGKGINLSDSQAVENELPLLSIQFEDGKVYVQGKDVTKELRDERVSLGSSIVAAIPTVRAFLVPLQQRLAKEKQEQGFVVVAEGRDTATKVFPHADVAIFLTATPEIRAKRRQQQIKERTGSLPEFADVLSDVLKRDNQDSTRSVDPLVTDPEKHGYVMIDNSYWNEQQTLDAIMQILQEKQLV